MTAKTAFGRLKQSWQTGKAQIELARLRLAQMYGDNSESTQNHIDHIKARMPPPDVLAKERSIPEKFLKATAEMLPLPIRGITEGAKYGLPVGTAAAATAFAAGQVGPQVATPEEVVTVPGAFLTWTGIGTAYGTTKYISEIEAGLAYDEFLSFEDEHGNKIDPAIAENAAAAVGIINGLLELAQIRTFLETIPGARTLVRKAVNDTTKKVLTSGSLKAVLARYVGRYGIFMGTETIQELWQETTNITFGEFAKILNNYLKGSDIPLATQEEIASRLIETGKQSAMAFTLMGLPGPTVAAGMEITAEKAPVVEVEEPAATPPKAPEAIVKPAEGKVEVVFQGKKITESARVTEKNGIYTFETLRAGKETGDLSRGGTWFETKLYEGQKSAYDQTNLRGGIIGVGAKGTVEGKIDITNPYMFDWEGLGEAKAILKLSEEVLGKETTTKLKKGITGANAEKAFARLEKAISEKLSVQGFDSVIFYDPDLEGTVLPKQIFKFTTPPAAKEVAKPTVAEELKPPPIEPVKPVTKKMTVADVMAEAEKIEPVEPVEIITEPGKVEVGVTVFTTVAQGQKLYKTPAIAKTAQSYENKIAKLKTQIQEAKAKAKAKLAYELGVQKAKTQQKLEKTKARYEKIVAHIKAVIARQKEIKKLRDYIKKLAKKIAKSPPLSVDFYYREAIEGLQAGIDPKFRAKKTLRMRERTREFLKRKPEALKDMPVKLMQRLNKKAITDYTVEELEQIATEIERLTKQGKLKRKLQLKQETKKVHGQRDEIIENVTKGKPLKVEKEPVVLSTTKEGVITKIERIAARPFSLTPVRIFDMIDGGLGTFRGIMHRIFYDQVSEAQNEELRATDKRKQAGMARLKELGMTLSDLTQTREIEGVVFTVDEMIGIYCAEKNTAAQLAIMYGNELSEGLIADVIDSLSENEKLWGDFIISEYEGRYADLRQAVIESENRDMGYEENYTPIRRQGVDYKTSADEIKAQVLMRQHYKKGYAEHGFSIRRKDIPAEFQKPINLRVTEVWLSQIAKQEHYINFSRLVKQLHRIADNKDFKQAIINNFNEDYYKAIDHYINRVANPYIYRSFGTIENASRALRGNVAIAYLGYNLLTIAKQAPSLGLYLGRVGPAAILSSVGEFIKAPLVMMDKVAELDPQVKHIALEREMEEIRGMVERGEYSKIIKTVGVYGMVGIRFVDKIVRTIGWNAIYEKMLENKASEAEAVREAQHITLRTQVGGFSKDIAELYATNEFLNWFTMFTSQLNKIYGIATYDVFAYWRNKEYQQATLAATGVGISAMLIWMIVHKKLPEDEEDIAEAFVEQAVNAVPLVGRAVSSGVRGWGDDAPPPFKAAKDLGRVYSARDKERAALRALESGAALGGVPVTAIKRSAKFIETEEPIELVGGRPK
jgi:hypothetical protein